MASLGRRGFLLGLVLLAACLPAARAADALDGFADALRWPDKTETAKLEFSEERTFPFRRFPKRFDGQMYRAPDGMLAIVYGAPANIRLVIEGDKILYDKGDGKLQPLPTDGADARAISDLLRGDIERLKADWNSSLENGALRLTPTLEPIANEIKYIEVTTDHGRVQTVEVHQKNQVVRKYDFGELTWIDGAAAAAPFAAQ
ncbi:hypothetical protein [Cerasicoccus maritimus]|uniref:hypothetical protein n=1 Tax=Cerasicoccus maritimus TaxID=490089 RepID=UPI002852815B|nr:hypothetical protein [Cerasicoccus maritimus]